MERSTPSIALTHDRLHARYARKIRGHVWAVLGPNDEIDDIVQDVLFTILRKIDTLRDPACLDGWVSQITTNTLRYFMRRRRLRRHASWEALPERLSPSSEPNPQARQLASRAMDVICRLPAKDRTLLSTYWFTSATADSIAAETGSSTITVRRRLLRARNRFEKLARRDPALAVCIDDTQRRGRRSGPLPETPIVGDSSAFAPVDAVPVTRIGLGAGSSPAGS
jgi:RNA polymerase sigma-70 factor, ECF subfamily